MRCSFTCTFCIECGEVLATFRYLLISCGLHFKSVQLSSFVSVIKAFLSKKSDSSVELI